jgi:hypothetical protein
MGMAPSRSGAGSVPLVFDPFGSVPCRFQRVCLLENKACGGAACGRKYRVPLGDRNAGVFFLTFQESVAARSGESLGASAPPGRRASHRQTTGDQWYPQAG